MNKIQEKRFRNLIRATRDASSEHFDMNRYAHNGCGSPACVLGNYAARRDLQRTINLDLSGPIEWIKIRDNTGRVIWYDSPTILDHFGITFREFIDLFASNGCDSAGKNQDRAVAYLESFLERKLAS